jgi:amino acid adenylation domain-containing protein
MSLSDDVPSLNLNHGPLSFAQKRIYLDQLTRFQSSSSYNISFSIDIEPKYICKIYNTLNQIIKRHSILRTYINNENLTQHIIPIELYKIDYEIIFIKDNKHYDIILNDLYNTNIDIHSRPFFVRLIKNDLDICTLYIVIHHIFFDGVSSQLFQQEFECIINNEQDLEEITCQYLDYTLFEIKLLQSDESQKDLEWWSLQLQNLTDYETDIIVDRLRTPNRNNNGYTYQYTFSNHISGMIIKFIKINRITINLFLYCILYTFFSRLCNQPEIILGGVIDNRYMTDIENILGMFVNTIAYKSQIDRNQTFIESIKYVKSHMMEINKKSYIPFDQILNKLNIKKQVGVHPLFQVVYTTTNDTEFFNTGNDTLVKINKMIEVKFDLTIGLFQDDNNMSINVQYSSELFDDNTIEILIKRLVNIVPICLNNINIRLLDIDIILPEEYTIIKELNQTDRDFNTPKCIHQMIVDNSIVNPDKTTVILDEVYITFQILIERCMIVARLLQFKYGVNNGDVIIQCLERSIEMVVGMIAIIMVGGVYCPIHPEEPIERIKIIISTNHVGLLITTSNYNKLLNLFDIEKLNIDITNDIYTDVVLNTNVDNIAYIIHTSGTTGQPKAIQITHRSLFYNLSSISQSPSCCDLSGNILQFSRCTFDVHISDILGTLFYGGTIILLNPLHMNDPLYLLKTLNQKSVTYMDTVPSMVNVLYEYSVVNKLIVPSVTHVILSGESCTTNQLEQLRFIFPNVKRLSNLYGPAECTITSTAKTYYMNDEMKITIGTPLLNYKCYVLNNDLQLVPLNHIGELYIGGQCVMKGYVDQTMTEKVIINHKDFGRIYKTGDLVKLTRDKNIIFIGRNDTQVKIRGQRLELSEIEKVILLNKEVNECVVIKREDMGEECLVAYIIGNKNIREDIMRECRQKLRGYMIPKYIEFMDKYPLNNNGKIDRKQLPKPTFQETVYIPPQTDIEHFVINCINKIFPTQLISMNDDLFINLGCNSFQFMTLLNLLRSKFSSISIADLFKHTQINDLCKYNNDDDIFTSSIQNQKWISLNINKCEVTPSMNALYMDDFIRTKNSNVYKVNWDFEFYEGLEWVTKESLSYALNKIVERHSILRSKIYFENNNVYQEVVDIETISCQEYYPLNEIEFTNTINQYKHRILNLEMPPLIYITLFHREQSKVVLLETHHIVYDHGCDSIYIEELSYFVEEFYNKENMCCDKLEYLPIQFIDFSYVQNKMFEEDFMSEGYQYWTTSLQNIDPYIYYIPTDRDSILRSFFSKNQSFDVNIKNIDKLRKECKTTTYNVIKTIFAVVLSKLNQIDTILLGETYETRYIQQTKNLIGYSLSVLPTVFKIDKEIDIKNIIQQTTDIFIKTTKYSVVPLQYILKRLEITCKDTIIPYLTTNITEVPIRLQSQDIRMYKSKYHLANFIETNTTDLDFTFYMYKFDDKIECEVEYLIDLYDDNSIKTLIQRFQQVIENIDQMDIILHEEYNIIQELNQPTVENNNSKCVNQLILNSSFLHPNNIAVVFDDEYLTYQELITKIINMSFLLQNQYGVTMGDIIIQYVERSFEMIIGMISILMIGGVYCPIHPDEPIERLNIIINNSKVRLILTTSNYNEILSTFDTDKVNIDTNNINNISVNNININTNIDSVAYIIHTSGTTGQPKAIQITHQSLYYYLESMKQEPWNVDFTGSVLQFSKCSFDSHIDNILGPLINGGKLVMLNHTKFYDTTYILDTITKNKITYMEIVASIISNLYDASANYNINLESVKHISQGGEVFTKNHLEQLRTIFPKIEKISNSYGPAECTITTTVYTHYVNKEEIIMTIGRPLKYHQVYILNKELNIVPINHVGELYIGGPCVMKGYMDKTMTEKVIINHKEYGRLYKTGDMVKLNSDKNIIFIGRNDTQVKIRGQRLELSEIEKVILSNKTVKECIVIKREDIGEECLVAYIIGKRKDKEYIIMECKKNLRSYMVPKYIEFVEGYPLNKNGKIDRKQLPKPLIIENEFIGPSNKIEEFVYECFSEIFLERKISMSDDIMEDIIPSSLQMMKVLNRLNQHERFKDIRIKDIFQCRTLMDLSTSQ